MLIGYILPHRMKLVRDQNKRQVQGFAIDLNLLSIEDRLQAAR